MYRSVMRLGVVFLGIAMLSVSFGAGEPQAVKFACSPAGLKCMPVDVNSSEVLEAQSIGLSCFKSKISCFPTAAPSFTCVRADSPFSCKFRNPGAFGCVYAPKGGSIGCVKTGAPGFSCVSARPSLGCLETKSYFGCPGAEAPKFSCIRVRPSLGCFEAKPSFSCVPE